MGNLFQLDTLNEKIVALMRYHLVVEQEQENLEHMEYTEYGLDRSFALFVDLSLF